jgi:hypothetical protein
VSEDGDGVRLSEEQRLDWLSPPIESIELLRALLRWCRVWPVQSAILRGLI